MGKYIYFIENVGFKLTFKRYFWTESSRSIYTDFLVFLSSFSFSFDAVNTYNAIFHSQHGLTPRPLPSSRCNLQPNNILY